MKRWNCTMLLRWFLNRLASGRTLDLTISIFWILFMLSCKGALIVGSAVDQIEQVISYASIGYPFRMTASIHFGRHHKAILQSPKPKLFIMGTQDGFTSVKQLRNKLNSAAGWVETHLVDGVGHFQMEGPGYDAEMVDLIIKFIVSLERQITD
ncbi:hypothetical protein E2542_SST28378 [Spatholobus suberectus]|nr:hypothetical protein E2542_SST28378 [Spatholobus suberectus]